MRQRHGIEQYRDLERTRRSDFRSTSNARGFTCAPAANDVPHAEDSSFGRLCFAILVLIAFAILAVQVMNYCERNQEARNEVHACEAQGLRAITVNDGVNDHIVCSAGAL
jgi:hypothetical protein